MMLLTCPDRLTEVDDRGTPLAEGVIVTIASSSSRKSGQLASESWRDKPWF